MAICTGCNGSGYHTSGSSKAHCGRCWGTGKDPSKGEDCVTGDAEVMTPCGWKKIECLSVGDLVGSRTQDGEVAFRKVLELRTGTTSNLVKVAYSDSSQVSCTDWHTFLTNRGWKSARSLHIGDIIASPLPDKIVRTLTIERISKIERPRSIFNLITDGERNYILKAGVSHNFAFAPQLRATASRLHRAFPGAIPTPNLVEPDIVVQRTDEYGAIG